MNWEVRTMRSATSCFNSTLYRKTMARFWPLWALYGVFWLFCIPLNLLNHYFDHLRYNALEVAQSRLLDNAQDIPYLLEAGVPLALVAGVLCAMAVFGYLYNHRSASMMHSLPMRRETLFLTQYLAGLSFLLLPNLAVAAVTAAAELVLLPPSDWGAALPALGVWLLAQSGVCLFFFSFAAFCAMFTGHVLALPAFYGILNILAYIISNLIAALMNAFFYGYPPRYYNDGIVRLLTPVWPLMEACVWRTRSYMEGTLEVAHPGSLEDPALVAGYAVAGLVLAVLALMVYRYRHVESAGDVVSIAIVRPFFQFGVAFCSGLCFGTLTAAFFGWQSDELSLTLSVLVWTAIGWFVAEMLLKKSFRVLGAWKGGLVMVAVMALLCGSFILDLFGVESRVPNVDEVEVVSVNAGFGYPYDDGNFNLKITDKDQIQKILDLHQAVVDAKDRSDYNSPVYESSDDYIYLDVTYTRKDGTTLQRTYHSVPVFEDEVDLQGSVTCQANQLIQDRDLVARCYNFDYFEGRRLVTAHLEGVYNQKEDCLDSLYFDGAASEDLVGLWQAVKTDYAEGTIGVRYLFNNNDRRANTYRTDLNLAFERQKKETLGENITQAMPYDEEKGIITTNLCITLTPNARNTLAWMEEMNVLGENYVFQTHNLLDEYGEEIIPEGGSGSVRVYP